MFPFELFAIGLLTLAPPSPPADTPPQRDSRTQAGATSAAAVRTPALEGTVKGPDGKPPREATVLVRCGRDEPWRTTRTDTQGRFRLEAVGQGPCTVRVEAPGVATALLERVQPGAPLQVALRIGGIIMGLVRDGATGQPVPGARVKAFSGESVLWEPKAGVVETTTDGSGSYQLRGLAPGLYTIRASAPGRRHARRGRVPIGQRADLLLLPEGSGIVGTVRAGDGKPIAGAVVAVERAAGSREEFSDRESPSARSDALGRFEIGSLDPTTYRLMIRHPSFAIRLLDGVVVEAGTDTSVEVALETAVSVIGRLVNPEERPVAGKVRVERLGGALLSPAMATSGILAAEAGTNGRFRVEGVPTGALTLAASAPGFGVESVDLHTKPDQTLVDLGDIKLEPGHVIRGRVSDRAGAPLAGALVSGFAQSPALRAHLGPIKGAAAADGSFVLAGLAPGTYTLLVSAHGHPSARVADLEPDGPPVLVELDSGGAVTGVVGDEGSRPVTAFQVEADPKAEAGFGGRESVAREDGRFLIEGLATGTYDLVVRAPDRPRALVPSITVSPGTTTDVGTVRLGTGGAVRGVVVDTTGGGVAGAVVTVLTPGNLPPTGFEPQATTDASGAFEARGVGEGTVLVKARHPRYAEAQASGIEVVPARGPSEVRLVLSQGGRIEGRVTRRGGEGVVGAGVQILESLAGGPQGPSRQLLVGPDGSFVADHLTPGVVLVRLVLDLLRAGDDAGLVKVVTLREGEVAAVEFRLAEVRLSGRVTHGDVAAGGMGLSFRAEANYDQGGGGAVTITGSDGSYQAVVGGPGRYRVRGETPDGKTLHALGTIEVPDVESWSADFEIGAVSVTGTVADQDTREPIAGARVTARAASRPASYAATSGGDGRFELELAEGAYRVSATADDYGEDLKELTVTAGGSVSAAFTLTRGRAIRGRVIDAGGRGLDGLLVTARASNDGASIGSSVTGVGGSFRLAGLRELPYNLLVAAESGFAFRREVVPGGEEITLTLRRGRRVHLVVRDPEGLPVPLAGVRLATVAGAPVVGLPEVVTDTGGVAEFPVPSEPVEVLALKADLAGRVRIPAEAGDLSADITLSRPQE